MGGWKLEVVRIAVYMMFPVGIFYYFNQPQYFEKWVVNVRRELYPPENIETKKQLQECMNEMREKKNKELLQKLGATD